MKKTRSAIWIATLTALTFIGGLLIWDGFVMPEDRWMLRYVEAAPGEGGKRDSTALHVQLVPWKGPDGKCPAVKGVAIGYFLQQKNVDGLSIGVVQSASDRKRAFSMSMVELSGDTSGLLMFLFGGSVRNRGCALGLWNMAEQNNGVQLGGFNQVRKDAIVEYPLKPEATEDGFGVQAGVVNYSEGRGVQIGLWNTNPRSWIKHFPIINFCL